MKQKEKFVYDWVSTLLKNVDSYLDEETKIRLIEECGRACAQRHTKKEAQKLQGDLDKWLSRMKKWIGDDNIQRKENYIRIIYSQCYCPLVKDSPPLHSDTYCHCSIGWLKENFETVLGRQVQVKLEDSIMMGGKECRFDIFLKK